MIRLNLGCGVEIMDGWVNTDLHKLPGVDVAWDLDDHPWPWDDDAAEVIRAFDVYEHVNDPLGFMGEAWRVLAPNGLLVLHTSYWLNPNSYRDPTHKRFLTEESFDYWIPGTMLNQRYGLAYARGRHFAKEQIGFDNEPPHADLIVMLRKIDAAAAAALAEQDEGEP